LKNPLTKIVAPKILPELGGVKLKFRWLHGRSANATLYTA